MTPLATLVFPTQGTRRATPPETLEDEPAWPNILLIGAGPRPHPLFLPVLDRSSSALPPAS